MAKAGRKRKHVRVEYDALGRPSKVEKGGTEIDGLSYDASSKSYYCRKDGKKRPLAARGKSPLDTHDILDRKF